MNMQIFKKYLGVALLLLAPLDGEMASAQSVTEECASSVLAVKGVSQQLAVLRAKEVSDVSYRLTFDLKSDKKLLVPGKVIVAFDYHPVCSLISKVISWHLLAW